MVQIKDRHVQNYNAVGHTVSENRILSLQSLRPLGPPSFNQEELVSGDDSWHSQNLEAPYFPALFSSETKSPKPLVEYILAVLLPILSVGPIVPFFLHCSNEISPGDANAFLEDAAQENRSE